MSMDNHCDRVLKISNELRLISGTNEKITLRKDNTCCFGKKYKENTTKIDISELHNIIECNIDAEIPYIVVEPGVTMENIVDYLLGISKTRPYMLPVISEFKQITIGGAINGLAGESSSFRHGLIDDIVIKYEIVSTNGTILTVTPTNIHSELFYSLPGSYGTLGIITQIWLRIEPTGKYVKVDYSKYNSLDRVTEEFKKETTESEYQFIEGIVLDKRTVIVSKAQTVKNIGWYDWLFCTSWFGYFGVNGILIMYPI